MSETIRNNEEEIRWIERSLDPSNERHAMLIRFRKSIGAEDHLHVIREAIDRFPEETFYWHMLGIFLTESDPDAAVEALQKAIALSEQELAPRSAFQNFWHRWIRRGREAVHYHTQLAMALEKSGRREEALAEWQHIFEVARQRRTYGDSRKTMERARKMILRLKEGPPEGENAVHPSA